MMMDYSILKKFLDCNKNIKLKFTEGTNTLKIIINSQVVSTIELSSNIIEENSELIYNAIINLDNITMYIPKIYTKK